MMQDSPRVIAIDDEEADLAALANSLARHGIPCYQIPFTDDFSSIPSCPHAEVIFADLHLGGGVLASDHMTDFSTIGAVLEERIKPSRPYVILLWTAYPDMAPDLSNFLGERLHSVTKPSGVLPLAKANHLARNGNVKDSTALVNEIVAITKPLLDYGARLNPIGGTPETTPTVIYRTYPPVHEAIQQRLTKLFEKPDGPRSSLPPGFPEWETTMDEWLDIVLPDFGSTPRQVLNSGDYGALALLDRFVNAIATSRALSHPRVVREIIRQRIETMFRESRHTDAFHRDPQFDPLDSESGNDVADSFEHWMDVPNPLFGDVSPRSFFEAVAVDADQVREISSLLDSIDDGAFS